MQKTIVGRESNQASEGSSQAPATDWIGTELISDLQVSSEDPTAPAENIFDEAAEKGWRASDAGEQHIRLAFREPMQLRRIRLEFVETTKERTQEFVLRCATESGWREVIRQRWNFSPQGSTREVEDYTLNLNGVSALELVINPDVSSGDGVASLKSLRLA
jgi:LAS superfamily LD-carboxypeptidase LdcB